MTSQTKTCQRLTLRRARSWVALAMPVIALVGCAAPLDDARWLGSVSVTQNHDGHRAAPAAPVLPGAMASGQGRFWDARRDSELGSFAAGAATASGEWPTQPRPNEQIFRFRTLQRN